MNQKHKLCIILIGVILLLISASWLSRSASAMQAKKPAAQQISPLHPTFLMLDEDGTNVLESDKPISTMKTCGACHDTQFIVSHSFHADVGLQDYDSPGQTGSGRPWDTSTGLFGKWNAINYRFLSPEGDDLIDLGTADWLRTIGIRHAGGGPATTSRGGNPLQNLISTPGNPQTNILDQETGELIPWDWSESGVIEMNCFLCHIPQPNNESRIETIHAGDFGWANTATLEGTGIVEKVANRFTWNTEAFDENGELLEDFVQIQDPTNNNCGQCHGLVHDNVEDPLVTYGCVPDRWSTITTGQIISPQRLSDSGMNLANKEQLTRSWDVHAERLLKCTDCHYSLNNPLYYEESGATKPDHLIFDPRRLDIGEYLLKPLHQFARGESAQNTVAPELTNTMRRCDSCHDTEDTHDWLPYKDRHFNALSCESCHIPQLYSSANKQQDWTVITTEDTSRKDCRGVEGQDPDTLQALLVGYEPVLLPRSDIDGYYKLAPYNLITSFYWVYGDPPRPVRLNDLKSAYFEGDDYHPGIVQRFDTNGNDQIEETELIIDTPEKEDFVQQRLSLLGLGNPRIVGEIQPYSINHDIAEGEWVTKDCSTCHTEESRLSQPIQLASYTPGGVMPEFIQGHNVEFNGEISQNEDGKLYYQPAPRNSGLYILGHNSVDWVDLIGSLAFVGVLLAITVHGGLRFYTSLRKSKQDVKTQRVYMYKVYERLWHWLQTTAIVLLLFSGLVIHKPDTFGIFTFTGVVIVHNALALLLAINAGLSLFYHLASGEIKQYIPRPRGFFDQMISQAQFYLEGIFKGDEHPFEKTVHKKLNPLQQMTYFGILNILLPLQGLTGILIWGAQSWPNIAESLGGLPFLAPVHTLVAWVFASFIVAHVYLTTTGYTPTAGIQAMMMGWEVIEVPKSGDDDQPKTIETVQDSKYDLEYDDLIPTTSEYPNEEDA